MKTIDVAKLALSKLSAADEAACSVSFTETREFTIDAGNFSLLRTLFDKKLSLSAIKDNKKGSVSQNDVSEEGIEEAAQNVFSSLESAQADEAWGFSKEALTIDRKRGDIEPKLEKLFDRTQELLEEIKANFKKISIEQLIVLHRKSESMYMNSHGVECKAESGTYSVSLMFSGHEGEKSSSFSSSGVICDNLDKPFMELGSIKTDLASAEKQIHTVASEGKYEGTIILTPDCSSDIVSTLLGLYVEDSVILEGVSQWKDKLDQKVVDERITIGMNPSSQDIVGGQIITGEGFLAKDFNVIENGVLKSFMLSYYVANKTGKKRAANDGSGMMVSPGTESIEDIIKGVKKGLLVGRFSGGSPGISGEFSGVAKNAFLIEDGKVTKAASETMISGNLSTMFNNLVAISKEVVKDGNSVMPYMAFSGITISGK